MKQLKKEEKREIIYEVLKRSFTSLPVSMGLLISILLVDLLILICSKEMGIYSKEVLAVTIGIGILPLIICASVGLQTSYNNVLQGIRDKEELNEIFQKKNEILVNDISDSAILPHLYYYATKNSECDNIIITRFQGEKRILVETILPENFFEKYKIL